MCNLRSGLLDRQLGACRLELDGLRWSFQAEQVHQAALLAELGSLRDQCREAQLTVVQQREREQSREVGAPLRRQLPVVDSPPVGPAAGPAGRLLFFLPFRILDVSIDVLQNYYETYR